MIFLTFSLRVYLNYWNLLIVLTFCIHEKAKFGGSLKPMLWWRYRDDIFDIFTQGLPKLLEFTDCINVLYPTIKFELVYSDSDLNVLALTLHFRDGFIRTDAYAKPTDSHLYQPFLSSHCKRAVPSGVALRIKRNCSTDDFLKNRCKEYKGYLRECLCKSGPVDFA